MQTTRIRRPFTIVAALALTILVATPALAQADQSPSAFYPATHSHNDYYQPRPLLDALVSGMGSIEADIFYVEIPFTDPEGEERAMRQLHVAHDWEEIEGNVVGFARSKGTLEGLYLDPLWQIYQATGTVYPQGTLLLHADMKTATEETWRVLENTLRNYPGLITTFDVASNEVTQGPVTVYTNAEPDEGVLEEYGTIHSTADGRFGDIFDPSVWESEAYTSRSWRMPIISSNFQAYIDIEQMFDFLVPREDIVAEYGDEYPDLTEDNLASELDRDGWELATQLIEDRSIRPSDHMLERLEEANRLGMENDHLMRFWATPDAQWFWDLVAPLENVMLLTDHPRDVRVYLESREMLDRIRRP
jgi:hypothetical protein